MTFFKSDLNEFGLESRRQKLYKPPSFSIVRTTTKCCLLFSAATTVHAEWLENYLTYSTRSYPE